MNIFVYYIYTEVLCHNNILLHIVSTNRKYVLNRPDNHLYNIQYTAQVKLDIKCHRW
jgi:hypothetical protein